jgi:hypothetical protein
MSEHTPEIDADSTPASSERLAGVVPHDCPEAQAWKDNYDGMFWRWAECDRERLALKQEVRLLRLTAVRDD